MAAQAQQRGFVMPEPLMDAAEIRALTDSFTFVRTAYAGTGAISANAWATDYPEADRQFSRQVAERLGLTVDEDGVILSLTDPALSQYPFIYLVEGGRLGLNDEEAAALRNYLVSGGFLMVDDFWGSEEWASLAMQLQRVFPDRPIIELPADHDVFHTFYPITERLPVPGIVELTAGDVREPHYRGIVADDGRLMAILLFNQDFGDAWEHIADSNYPAELAFGGAVAMGINIVVYALMY